VEITMRRIFITAAAVITIFSLVAPSAGAEEVLGGPLLAKKAPTVQLGPGAEPLPQVFAKTWVLADATTGAVLAAKGAHIQRAPASTLKSLTALTLLPILDPNQVYRPTRKVTSIYGSRVGLVPGKPYTADELFYGLMLPSGNDAAVALAKMNGGVKTTVSQMNGVAASLQALNTNARNTSGLDAPGQVSSAYDLALIARAGLERPDFVKYSSAKSAQFPAKGRGKTKTIYNQNRLLTGGYKGAIGVKTGFTTKAGRTFVAAAERNGTTLIVSLMGVKEQSAVAAQKLLDWGFANSRKVTPIGALVSPVGDNNAAGAVPVTAVAAPETAPETTEGDSAASMANPTSTSTAGISVWSWGWLALFLFAVVAAFMGLRNISRNRRGRHARPGRVRLER
jgi:D-alanyl-D-alanine carboxypeptidase (penicillin-binding protein 5/6)